MVLEVVCLVSLTLKHTHVRNGNDTIKFKTFPLWSLMKRRDMAIERCLLTSTFYGAKFIRISLLAKMLWLLLKGLYSDAVNSMQYSR